MAKTLQQKMTELQPARRRRVEARSRSLIAEEMVLAELRPAIAGARNKLAKKQARPFR